MGSAHSDDAAEAGGTARACRAVMCKECSLCSKVPDPSDLAVKGWSANARQAAGRGWHPKSLGARAACEPCRCKKKVCKMEGEK
jgi:hypothetical protein